MPYKDQARYHLRQFCISIISIILFLYTNQLRLFFSTILFCASKAAHGNKSLITDKLAKYRQQGAGDYNEYKSLELLSTYGLFWVLIYCQTCFGFDLISQAVFVLRRCHSLRFRAAMNCKEKKTINFNICSDIVSRGHLLGKPANIKVENNCAVGYVGSSLTVYNPLFFVLKL